MTETAWLTEIEQRAWRGLVQMHAGLIARLGRRLQADSGLSVADYEVLVALTGESEGRLRPFQLAEQLQWEQSRLSHHLARMQRRGLVGREHCPEDARGAFVVLTSEGRRAIEGAAPDHVQAVRHLVFDVLTDDEVAMLEHVTDRVLTRLTQTEAMT